jgi:uncharacterized protein YjgD (DUF1641 family)
MAKAVEFREFTPKNSRQDLLRRLEAAPEKHVEAILSVYELLQRMHDKGVIDLANGLLNASDTVVDKVADLANSTEITSTMRLTFMLANLIKALDIDQIHGLLSGTDVKPASLFGLGRQAMSEDARLGMTVGLGLLSAFGAALRKEQGRTAAVKSDAVIKVTERFFTDEMLRGRGSE